MACETLEILGQSIPGCLVCHVANQIDSTSFSAEFGALDLLPEEINQVLSERFAEFHGYHYRLSADRSKVFKSWFIQVLE